MVARALLAAALALGSGQDPDLQVSARIDRATVEVGETVRLVLSVRGSGFRTPEIEAPDLAGFELLGTSDRSSFRISTAVGTVREFTREYTLRVEQPGQLTIPPFRVSVAGRLFETEAIAVRSVDGRDPGLPEVTGPVRDDVALRLWVEPETAYVGQQVTLTVAAFFQPLVRSRLQRQPEYRAPDVQGVWTADLPGPARPERRVVEGREYYVQVFRRALFPLSPGRLRIPPASVVYEIRRGLIYAPETFQIESAPAAIEILPLPAADRPEDFGGAVGRYQARSEIDRPGLHVGEALNLVLEVQGAGNVSSLGRPVLPDVPGFRVYDGGEDAEVQIRGTELAGQKRFSWVLVPEEAGDYVLPALRMPFYDPLEATYRVATTEPIPLQVEPASAGYTQGISENRTIRYIKHRPGPRPAGLSGRPVYWMTLALPLALLIAGWTVRRASGRFGAMRTRTAGRGRSRAGRMREIRALARGDDPRFFAELREMVNEWLAGRFSFPDQPSGADRIARTLGDAGVPPTLRAELDELLARCDQLRYRPGRSEPSERDELLDQVEDLLTRIDREAVEPRRLSRATRSALLGGLVLISLGAAASEVPTRGSEALTSFEEGVAAYARGEYSAALDAFEQALGERPGDPHALYNLGNVHFELGAVGHAVAHWVRALRIDPRDRDARFNLRFVQGEDPVIGQALPLVPLAADELTLGLALLWYVACGLLLVRLFRPARPLAPAALVSASGAVLMAVLLFWPRPEIAVLTDSEAVLRAGPVRQSEALATPAPGTGFRILEVRHEWLKVTRDGNAEGWVQREDVEVIGRSDTADRGRWVRLTPWNGGL